MSTPKWMNQLTWSSAVAVSDLKNGAIPVLPGCYAFTQDISPLVRGGVLYIGKADNLRQRLSTYLVDYMTTSATKHKGKAFLFEFRQKHGNSKLYVRWTVYGDPRTVEGGLIGELEPWFNSQWESEWLSDEEELDPRFLP